MAGLTLAQVLERFGPAYLREHALTARQARVWRAIHACRTAALGGQRWRCDQCADEQWRWHSCRNRHCPRCQSRAREAWRVARLREMLDVPYGHLVFTLPHEINALAAAHPRAVYELLMGSVADTLREFAANPRWLGGQGAFTLVLHTWTQDLRRHLHVHALMACGALDEHGQWREPVRSPTFLFPVQALSKVFRSKFLAALQQIESRGLLPRDPQASGAQRQARHRALRRHPWVVYAKTPMGGPGAVLDYLSRYTHRTAIGHERLLAMTPTHVKIRVRQRKAGGKRVVTIPGERFIGRFLAHVLPAGFKRIRHYGLLAPAVKRERLARARASLSMPQPNPIAQESAQAFMKRVSAVQINTCARCAGGRYRCVQTISCRQAMTLGARCGPWQSGAPP